MRSLTRVQKEQKTLRREHLQPGYIQNKVDGGFIRNSRFPTILQGLMDTLQSVYPDLWDIQFEWETRAEPVRGIYTDRFYIVIRFPEFIIKNSRNLQTKIQNLFVRVPVIIKPRSLEFERIQGGRSTFTNAENGTYIHSHIRDSAPCSYYDFCTGSGEINNLQAMLNGMTNTDFDFDLFSLFLMHLNTFVSWESLEGTPYKHISTLLESTDAAKPIRKGHLNHYYTRIVTNFKRPSGTVHLDSIKWRIHNGKYEIVDNLQLDKALLMGMNGVSLAHHLDAVTCMRNNRGEYIKQRVLVNQSSTDPTIYFLFRGDKIPYEITDDFEPLHDPELYINPSIKNYFKKQLENAANSKAITKSYL